MAHRPCDEVPRETRARSAAASLAQMLEHPDRSALTTTQCCLNSAHRISAIHSSVWLRGGWGSNFDTSMKNLRRFHCVARKPRPPIAAVIDPLSFAQQSIRNWPTRATECRSDMVCAFTKLIWAGDASSNVNPVAKAVAGSQYGCLAVQESTARPIPGLEQKTQSHVPKGASRRN
jgi:hypothetical protein